MRAWLFPAFCLVSVFCLVSGSMPAFALEQGDIVTVAGNGDAGFSGDNGAAILAGLNFPEGVVLDASGNMYIADTYNNRIRKVTAGTGAISTVAGTGEWGDYGDNCPATAAELSYPTDVAIDSAGNLYIADMDYSRIRKVDVHTGIITTVAGSLTATSSGDNVPATSIRLQHPVSLAFDSAGNLYFAELLNHRIRRVDAVTGIITTVAGNGTAIYSGDNIPATSASLYAPSGVALDSSGNIYIADTQNYRVRKVDAATGIITTVAGNGTSDFSGDNGPAILAALGYPERVALDSSGNLYISDASNQRIRKVDAISGIITTVAGNGTYSFSGDNGPATAAALKFPYGIRFDTSGNMYVADLENSRIRKVLLNGLVISPQSLTFPAMYLGDTISQTVTVNSITSATGNIDSAVLSGPDAAAFSLGDTCSGQSLTQNGSCTITVNFTPVSCGYKNAVLTVTAGQSKLPVHLSGNACGVGTAELAGEVIDGASGLPLSGATVTVGAEYGEETIPLLNSGLPLSGAASAEASSGPVTTDASGSYQLSGLASGTYPLTVAKSGYETWRGYVTLLPSSAHRRNVSLNPSASGFRVVSVRSKYSTGKPYYFLPGINFEYPWPPFLKKPVKFTASVDWNGRTPKTVRFITPRGQYDVATITDTATIELYVGDEFDSCSTLQAVAIAADNSQSSPKNADFFVTKDLPEDPQVPLLRSSLGVAETYSNGGTTFKYRNKSVITKTLLNQLTGAFAPNMPVFGKNNFMLQWIPEMDFEFSGDEGKAKYELKFKNFESLKADGFFTKRKNPNELKHLVKLLETRIKQGKYDRRNFPKTSIAGIEGLLIPSFSNEFKFNPAACGTTDPGWSGSTNAGLATELSLAASYQSLVTPFGAPIPWYVKAKLGVSGDFSLNVTDAINGSANGDMSLNPSAALTIGAGVDGVIGLEGTGKGGVDTKTKWSFSNGSFGTTLDYVKVYMEASAKAYALVFEKEVGPYRWEQCVKGSCSIESAPRSAAFDSGAPRLIPRDYLATPLKFMSTPNYAVKSFATAEGSYSVATSPIFTSVYPQSAANLTSSGSNVNLLWLKDNETRTSPNRTMVMHATFNGTTWSTPAAIADNGSADFSPASLTFADGSMVAVWENVKTVLPDTATLEEMTAQLEISAAIYNPVTRSWGSAVQLSNNATLDRTPRVAGVAKNNLLLTWIGNDQNDLYGSATKPNRVYFALYNGTSWGPPQIAATVPNAIKRYSVVYDGTSANMVLALDMDGDTGTIDDLELHRLIYTTGPAFSPAVNGRVIDAGGGWGPLTRLTIDMVIDDNPQLALDPASNVVLTWVKGNELTSVTGFDFANRTVIRAEQEYSATLADFRLATATDGKVAIIYSDASDDNTSDLFGVFYDPIFNLWGEPKQLTADAETEIRPAIAFLGNDTIIPVFNRRLMINPDGTPTSGALTDLYMLKYAMGHDLALEAGSLMADPANAAPGDSVNITVNAQNLGDKAAQNVPVSFYNGDPAAGGTLIGTTTIVGPFKPGDAAEVSVPWTIPATTNPLTIYAVIDPAAAIDPLNRSNNIISRSLALPDLLLQSIRWEKTGAERYQLIIPVVNIGGTASPASTLTIRQDSVTGTVLTTLPVGSLPRFASADYVYQWNASATPRPWQTVVASVDEAGVIQESDENNNSAVATMPGSVAEISAIPPAVSFGNVAIMQTATQILTIRNSGNAPLTVSAVTVTGPQGSEFKIVTGGASTCASSTPTLEEGLSCTLAVTATPSVLGARTATIVITSNGATSTLPIALTANGVIDGACGAAAGQTFLTAPTADLCASGTASIVTTSGSSIWSWLCSGSPGGAVASCSTMPGFPLTVTFAGTGGGSVSGGMACTSDATCPPKAFVVSSGVTLMATANATSLFSGWSGACTGAGNCSLVMNAAKTATATFAAAPKAKVGNVTFTTLQAAYSAPTTTDNAVIKLLAGNQAGTLSANRDISVTLDGGYNAAYISAGAETTISSPIRISKGTVKARRVKVK